MSVKLLAGEGAIWAAITTTARAASRADVAVAYVGQGGAALLPLGKGSRLVVDASEACVKSGATCPAELLKLHKKGVAVYSRPDLHAKVFAFPKRAFIGSTNVSSRSKTLLVEAAVETTDPKLVSDARQFVRELCGTGRLGPEELSSLQEIYRPPRVPGGRGQPGPGRRRQPTVWIAGYSTADFPAEYEEIEEAENEAVCAIWDGDADTHYLDATWTAGEPRWQRGDTIVWIDDDDPRSLVWPPARVIEIRTHTLGGVRHWFTHTEHPHGNRCAFGRMARSLGRGWRKRLEKDGRLKVEHAAELIRWWDRRGVGA